MFRRIACVLSVCALTFGFAGAETLRGRITKIEGNQITFQAYDKKVMKYAEPKVYEADKDIKVYTQPTKEAKKEPLAKGLQDKSLNNLSKKGRTASVNVDDATGKITEIILHGGKPMKKKNGKN